MAVAEPVEEPEAAADAEEPLASLFARLHQPFPRVRSREGVVDKGLDFGLMLFARSPQTTEKKTKQEAADGGAAAFDDAIRTDLEALLTLSFLR